MAERLDGSVILAAIRDASDRAPNAKQVASLADVVKDALAEILESNKKTLAKVSALENLENEHYEALVKEHAKTRAKIGELAEKLEKVGGGDSEQTPKWVIELLGTGKAFGKHLLGDDVTVEVARERIRELLKGGAKKIASKIVDPD